MNLAQFLECKELGDVHRQGNTHLARCPAHRDQHPSLSISEGEDGRILLHCWAGCSTSAILAALGLRWVDLFPKDPGRGDGDERRRQGHRVLPLEP